MMRILRKTALRAAVLAAALSVCATGCSGLGGPEPALPAPSTKAPQAQRIAADALTNALASCGLASTREGVTLRDSRGMTLVSQPRERPTDVVAASARCVLTDLGMPDRDASLFDSTMAVGGFQTLQWGRWSATLKVTDTLRFEIDVIPQAA